MQTYRYAHTPQQERADILSLTDTKEAYTCIGCGGRLIPKIHGTKRDRHFAHKPDQAGECSGETYLHKLAKITFHAVYQNCLDHGLPFYLQTVHDVICPRSPDPDKPCVLSQTSRRSDLTKKYDGILLEQRDGPFIPDVLLFNQADPQQKCYIEFAVSHALSAEKEASDRKIIEIDILSERDVQPIQNAYLPAARARFVNLTTKPISEARAECPCEQIARQKAVEEARQRKADEVRRLRAGNEVMPWQADRSRRQAEVQRFLLGMGDTEAFLRDLDRRAEETLEQARQVRQDRERRNQEDGERLRTMGARRAKWEESARWDAAREEAGELPDGCVFRCSQCEIWRETEKDVEQFAVYTRTARAAQFATEEEAFRYCDEARLICP